MWWPTMAEVAFQVYWSKTRMVEGQRGGPAQIARGVALDASVVRETLAEFGKDALTAAKRGLYVLAEEIITESKKRVPVDTGNLRASGHVLPAEIVDNSATIIFGYGGPAGVGNQKETNAKAVGYALPVHERFDVSHEKRYSKKQRVRFGTATGARTGAKYLESVLLEFAPRMEARLGWWLTRELHARQ